MTGQQIITMFQNLTGESLDSDEALQLLNVAKNDIEGERIWVILKKVDSSKTTTIGGTYATSIDLPSDFALDIKIVIDEADWYPIMFEEQIAYKDNEGYYFIDHGNSKYYLCGTITKANTIYFFYQRFSPEITISTSWVFPERFHPYLAFRMADIYQAGLDADEIAFRMSDKQKEEAERLYSALKNWNAMLIHKSMDKSTERGGLSSGGTANSIKIR